MIINNDCIRNILIYLGDELRINYTHNKVIYDGIHMDTIVDQFKNEYKTEDIVYSLIIMIQNKYISSNNFDFTNPPYKIKIDLITYEGQQFLESIRPETVWAKTKNIISKVGSHSLKFIEKVAHDVAVEASKAIINATVSK